MDFDTLANTGIAGTAVTGRVFASELAPAIAARGQLVNRPLAGARISVDGKEQELFAVTDASGNFRLDPAPAGPFFVHIDGRTVNVPGGGYPKGRYYPSVGKEWVSRIGEEVSIGNIFLPLIQEETLQPVSATQETTITLPTSILQQFPHLTGVQITVPANSLFRNDGTRSGGLVGIAPVAPDRLPSPLPPGLNVALVITVQTDGAENFDRPVSVCFPNLPDPVNGRLLGPGAKSALWSFNHDIGDWEVVGSMTVSADGTRVCSDPGVGIRQPGWHTSAAGGPVTGGDLTSGRGTPSNSEPGGKGQPPAGPCLTGDCPEPPDEVVDPVYLFSGEFYLAAEDLRIPGRGFDFVWARKYRSRTGANTRQGRGWDCAYNISLEAKRQNLVLGDGNSRRDEYVRQPNGSWVQREFFREITRNADNSYTLTFADQGRWNFHALDGTPPAGKLAQSVDRNGNTMRFEYDAQGRLVRVLDTLDRSIVIAYNAADLISTVTDFAGRVVRYQYYDGTASGGSAGDLKSVTTPAVVGTPNGNDFPDGKTTTYTYSTGFADDRLNHNLLTVTDGRRNDPNDATFGSGPFVVNVYAPEQDPAGANFDRVVRQFWGGDVVDMVYDPLLPSNANDRTTMRTIVNDRNGNVREYFFDERNRVVRRREFTGRADPRQPTTSLANRPLNKLRPGDPDFFETIYHWNEDSLPTQEILPNGNVLERVFESDLNPQAPARVRGNLRIVRHLPGQHLPGGDQAVIEERVDYDTDGGNACCGFNFVTRYTSGNGNFTAHEYDARGNRIRTRHRIATIIEEYEHNDFGQITAHVWPDNGSGQRRRDTYAYYTEGPQRGYVRTETIDAANEKLTVTYEYDAVGNPIRVTDARGHDTRSVVNSLNQVVRRISPEADDNSGVRYQRDFFFDANDNVIRTDIQNIDDRGVLQPNTHFTRTYEYGLLSRICGWVAVRVVFQDCDIELLPERDRSESRRLVWSSLESCC